MRNFLAMFAVASLSTVSFGCDMDESDFDLDEVEFRCSPSGDAGIVALNEVTISGTADIVGNPADIFANNKVTLAGVVTVQGDVISGGSVSTSGNPNISGQVVQNAGTFAYPPPTAAAQAAKAHNNNAALKVGKKSPISAGELKLSGQTTLNMPGGVYYFEKGISISGQAKINVQGPVKIYVNGSVRISGISNTNNNEAHRLELFSVSSDSVNISGTSTSTLHVIAPLADVRISGTADFHGTVLGYDVNLSGTPYISSAGDAAGYDSSCDPSEDPENPEEPDEPEGPDLPAPPH
jgi:hypothetical protein